jgi:8-amino-7-oxononanoate synthase
VLDFSSALYLGLRHGSGELRPWAQLTTGVPAALEPPPGAEQIASRLARLIGTDAATLAPSTLHLFWDLLSQLLDRGATVYVDEHAYPIARWGAERAAARGVRLRLFAHHDTAALCRALRADAPHRRPPVVLADGLCPGCGRVAPTSAYLAVVQRFGGRLVIDDTQALGVLGAGPGPAFPFGRGGGGSLRWHGLSRSGIVAGASLAKGFGVPVAVLAGPPDVVARFRTEGETRVHCSPPSVPVLRAAEHALDTNAAHGDALRNRLAGLLRRLRERLAAIGLWARGGLFPVQELALPPAVDPAHVHRRLLGLGIRSVVRRGERSGLPQLCLLITAAHRPADIDRLTRALALVVGGASPAGVGGTP